MQSVRGRSATLSGHVAEPPVQIPGGKYNCITAQDRPLASPSSAKGSLVPREPRLKAPIGTCRTANPLHPSDHRVGRERDLLSIGLRQLPAANPPKEGSQDSDGPPPDAVRKLDPFTAELGLALPEVVPGLGNTVGNCP